MWNLILFFFHDLFFFIYIGDFTNARQYYKRAKDYLALVRVHCHDKDYESAADVVLQTSNKSASYFLAQQHELNNNINDAIDFYSRAGRYNHAVRLGKFEYIYIYIDHFLHFTIIYLLV